jgi:hypothetical protein
MAGNFFAAGGPADPIYRYLAVTCLVIPGICNSEFDGTEQGTAKSEQGSGKSEQGNVSELLVSLAHPVSPAIATENGT